jgi:hypothetical protein
VPKGISGTRGREFESRRPEKVSRRAYLRLFCFALKEVFKVIFAGAVKKISDSVSFQIAI